MSNEAIRGARGVLPRRPIARAALALATLGAGAFGWLVGSSPTLGALTAAACLVALLGTRALRPRLAQALVELRGRQPEELDALVERIGTDEPLPRLGGWAADPDFLLLVVEAVERRRPGRILELGSGASTVVLSLAVRRFAPPGAVVQSLEQDRSHAEATRRELARRGLDDTASVRHAPLEDRAGARPWYSARELAAAAAAGPFDLVVIDGPSTASDPLAREPSLPAIEPHLAEGALIVLDDMGREGERALLERYLEESATGFDRRDVPTAKGATVLERRGAER